jgi:hypothetical protein
MAWFAKGTNGLPMAILCAFYKQKMSITLHRPHVAAILKCAIIASKGFSWFITLSSFISLSFCDMFLATNECLGT